MLVIAGSFTGSLQNSQWEYKGNVTLGISSVKSTGTDLLQCGHFTCAMTIMWLTTCVPRQGV